MFQEDPLIKRLKELTRITRPTEKEFQELAQIKKDLGLDEEIREEGPAIPQIQNTRHKLTETRAKQEELRQLVKERKELELRLSLLFFSKCQVCTFLPVMGFNILNRYVYIPLDIFLSSYGSIWSGPQFHTQVIQDADIKILGDYSIRRLQVLGDYKPINQRIH